VYFLLRKRETFTSIGNKLKEKENRVELGKTHINPGGKGSTYRDLLGEKIFHGETTFYFKSHILK